MDFFRFNPADITEGITNKDNLFAGSPRIMGEVKQSSSVVVN